MTDNRISLPKVVLWSDLVGESKKHSLAALFSISKSASRNKMEATTNQARGRPTRKTAGKRAVDPVFVNSTEVIQDALSDMIDENKELMNGGRGRGRKRKRAKSPSPLPIPKPLSTVEVLNEAHFTPMEETPVPENLDRIHCEPISLTFNIPLGFEGPLKVELDPSKLFHRSKPSVPQRAQYVVEPAVKRIKMERVANSAQRSNKIANYVQQYGMVPRGFLDLPPELRNTVYRMAFVSEAPIDFGNPHNCQRSSALLRTCKKVHEEGTSILYSENRFTFRRNRSTRTPFWAILSKEIGYLDMRHFLHMIGQTGRGFLRRVHVVLEDGNKNSSAQLESDGRYTHDANLIDCWKIIARDCYLQKMALSFQGRRELTAFDVRFLEILTAIEVDKIVFNPGAEWPSDKFDKRAHDLMVKKMIRPEPLYDPDPPTKHEKLNSYHHRWEKGRYW